MASINNHVNVVTSTTGVSISKPGFGKLLLLTSNADWPERTREYASAAEVSDDWAADSPEQLAANAIFGQTPCPESIKIGRRALPSTLKYTLSLVHATAGIEYGLTVKGEGVTETEVAYTALDDITVEFSDSGASALTINVVAVAKTYTRTTGSFLDDGFESGMNVTASGFTNAGNNGVKTIDAVTDLVMTMASSSGLVDESGNANERVSGPNVDWNVDDTFRATAHGMTTGDGPYRFTTTSALPTGISVDTNYWIIATTADTFQVATSHALALAGTEVNMSTSGDGVHTLQRDANDVIVAQIVDRLNSVTGANYTAAIVAGGGDTDHFTITADAAGAWFSIQVSSVLDLVSAMTHADAGVATDLAAIQVADQDWYAIYGTSNSNLEAKAIAAWASANKKFYMADFSETKAITVAVGGATDTIDDLHTLGYSRVATFYHPDPSLMAGAAWLGRCLPINPGLDNWKFKPLEGISAVELTSTQRDNLTDKAGNSVEYVLGAVFTFNGTTTDDGFINTRRNLDFVDAEIGTRVLAYFVGNDNVPFTNKGISNVKGMVRAALMFCASDDNPIFDIDRDIIVTAPDVSDVSPTSRAARILPNIAWSAYEAGSVNEANPIRGLVIQ